MGEVFPERVADIERLACTCPDRQTCQAAADPPACCTRYRAKPKEKKWSLPPNFDKGAFDNLDFEPSQRTTKDGGKALE